MEDQRLDKPGPGYLDVHQDHGDWLFSQRTQLITCWIAAVLVAGTGVYLATASGKPRTPIEADE